MTNNFAKLISDAKSRRSENTKQINKKNKAKIYPYLIQTYAENWTQKEKSKKKPEGWFFTKYGGERIRIATDFSSETVQVRQEWKHLNSV